MHNNDKMRLLIGHIKTEESYFLLPVCLFQCRMWQHLDVQSWTILPVKHSMQRLWTKVF